MMKIICVSQPVCCVLECLRTPKDIKALLLPTPQTPTPFKSINSSQEGLLALECPQVLLEKIFIPFPKRALIFQPAVMLINHFNCYYPFTFSAIL